MHKLFLTALTTLTLFTACQATNTAEDLGTRGGDALQQEEGGRVLLSNRGDTNSIYKQSTQRNEIQRETTKMGYSRRQKHDDTAYNRRRVAYVDRETLANIITDMEIKLPDVTDAATMVTDDEVFVVYRANTTDPMLVEDQVQKTALSVVPRYYHIYTSTEQKLMTQIESLQSGRMNNTEFAKTVDMLKGQMRENEELREQGGNAPDRMLR